MRWFNAEVISQLLDTMAFVLVTPEFLGEQTLGSIRSHLMRFLNFLNEQIFNRANRVAPYFWLVFIVVGIITIMLWFLLAESGEEHPENKFLTILGVAWFSFVFLFPIYIV